jgi:hypothetical protein
LKEEACMHPRCVDRHTTGGRCHHRVHHRISCEEYAELMAWARGRCQICGIAEADTPLGKLYIDHTEQPDGTGRWKRILIRGLVCPSCNTLMSMVDGNRRWRKDRTHEQAARRYAADPWYLRSPADPNTL